MEKSRFLLEAESHSLVFARPRPQRLEGDNVSNVIWSDCILFCSITGEQKKTTNNEDGACSLYFGLWFWWFPLRHCPSEGTGLCQCATGGTPVPFSSSRGRPLDTLAHFNASHTTAQLLRQLLPNFCGSTLKGKKILYSKNKKVTTLTYFYRFFC